MGFVLFEADFPSSKCSLRAERRENIEEVLKTAVYVCRKEMFNYAPIDKKEINKIFEEEVGEPAGNIEMLIEEIRKIKPISLKRKFKAVVKKEGAEIFALSYYLNKLTENFVVKTELKGKPENKWVALIADWEGWRVVRKRMFEGSEDEEVLMTLAAIHNTAYNKVIQLFYPNEIVEETKKISFSKLHEIFENENEKIKNSKPIVKYYLINKIFESSGITPFVSPISVAKVYPELKLPGIRGRRKK